MGQVTGTLALRGRGVERRSRCGVATARRHGYRTHRADAARRLRAHVPLSRQFPGSVRPPVRAAIAAVYDSGRERVDPRRWVSWPMSITCSWTALSTPGDAAVRLRHPQRRAHSAGVRQARRARSRTGARRRRYPREDRRHDRAPRSTHCPAGGWRGESRHPPGILSQCARLRHGRSSQPPSTVRCTNRYSRAAPRSSAAAFAIFSLPNALDAINGTIHFDSRGIRLDDVTATLGDGRVQFGGRIELNGYLPGDLNVIARGEDMHLRYPEGVRSTVDADLTIRGNVKAPMVGGVITVKDAIWSRRINPDRRILRASAGTVGSLGRVERRRRPSRLTLDVEVLVPGTLRIENNLARLWASADLQLRGTYDRPLLLRARGCRSRPGDLRGTALSWSRRARSSSPTSLRIDPFFDVEAETRVRVPGQTYRVTVRAAGTMERLQPTLESDPPLPAAEVLALLFSDIRRDPNDGRNPRASQSERAGDGHPHDTRHAVAGEPHLLGGRPRRRTDVRRRYVPAVAVPHRSLQPIDLDAREPFRSRHDRQARVRSRLSDVLPQPQLVHQRSDHACSNTTRATACRGFCRATRISRLRIEVRVRHIF